MTAQKILRPENILVIKLAALGDFLMGFAAFSAIRAHHPKAKITLLTTKNFSALAARSGWFDEIQIDTRPKISDLGGWIKLRAQLRAGDYSRVYDLQTSGRSMLYGRLFWPDKIPEWCGHAPFATHRHMPGPVRNAMHAWDMRREQLRIAGILDTPLPDLSWLDADISRFHLRERFALICAGASPTRPRKRWSAGGYAAVCNYLLSQNITPVLLGADAEEEINAEISVAAPGTVNLTGRTDLFDIAALARRAAGAIGNDTGPMHLIAACGCPTLSLFSGDSLPSHSRPVGAQTAFLQRDDLNDLRADEVVKEILLRQ